MGGVRNAAQRRAYIETARRCQPVEELERKARKAASRRRRYPPERSDLTIATSWRWDRAYDWTDCGGYCYLCSQFGTWNHEQARYVAPPVHVTRCQLNPVNDGPYPGWAAAGRAAIAKAGPRS